MKVLRVFETDDRQGFQMGDKITVPYNGQDFTATCQIVKDGDALFFSDDCIGRRRMNDTNTNKGGYAESDLKKWIDKSVFPALRKVLGERLQSVDIPTVEQLFGSIRYKYMEKFDCEQLPLQKIRQNRICCDPRGDWGCYWLQNRYYSAYFINVIGYGSCSAIDASTSNGVRIAFVLKNSPEMKLELTK